MEEAGGDRRARLRYVKPRKSQRRLRLGRAASPYWCHPLDAGSGAARAASGVGSARQPSGLRTIPESISTFYYIYRALRSLQSAFFSHWDRHEGLPTGHGGCCGRARTSWKRGIDARDRDAEGRAASDAREHPCAPFPPACAHSPCGSLRRQNRKLGSEPTCPSVGTRRFTTALTTRGAPGKAGGVGERSCDRGRSRTTCTRVWCCCQQWRGQWQPGNGRAEIATQGCACARRARRIARRRCSA